MKMRAFMVPGSLFLPGISRSYAIRMVLFVTMPIQNTILERVIMKLNRSVISAISIFLVLCCVSNYCSADSAKKNAISIGGGGGVGSGAFAYLGYVQYERLLTRHFALNANVNFMHYEYDDDDYCEEGDHYGAQVDVHLYPFAGDEGLKWLYLGVGIGVGQTNWESREEESGPGYFSRTSESGDSISWEPHFRLGSKFYLGSSGIYIDPAIQIGDWLNSDLELGFYAALLVSVGFAF